jgi:hypothetical protein
MKYLRRFFWIALVLFTGLVQAQEVVVPLAENVRLKGLPVWRTANLLDTLQLPFVDDFSDSEVHPSPARWVDRDVFINADIAIHPPTLGVATFDGLNAQGKAYDNSSPTTYGQADFLSSHAIDLSSQTPADSIYLSFFLQPKGWGDAPEIRDSMVLQFFNSAAQWVSVFSRAGSQLDTFRQVFIGLTNPDWFHAGFRFRFTNYASLTGFVDLWHLDYVRLAASRTVNDTLLDDVAFRSRPTSLLNRYQEMPYHQFKADSLSYRAASHGATAINLNQDKNTGFNYRVLELQQSSTVFSSTPFSITFTGKTTFDFSSPVFPIPNLPQDSLTLEVSYRLNAVPDLLMANDTVRRIHRFWNHYAYDDGIAEASYGLNVLAGQLAYKFDLAQADSLRGMLIYFVQNTENVANELFNLKVWNYIGEGQLGGNEQVLYEQTLLSPEYADSLGTFYYYPFESAVAVSDSFYIGWQQGTNKILNLGLDRNNNASSYMHVNTDGRWTQSIIAGAWMMRPVVGKAISWPTAIRNDKPLVSKIYPNPTREQLYIETAGDFSYEVMDMQGRLLDSGSGRDRIELQATNWPAGLYLLRLHNTARQLAHHKFIIQH